MERDRIVELGLGIRPEAAVSGAMLFQTEGATHLLFNAMRVTPAGAGEGAGSPTIDEAGTAVALFTRCLLTRFGYPNDEARWGIPRLASTSYGIYEVEGSSWIEEIVRLNRLRFPSTRDDYVKKHYVFAFHDSTFECLADDMTVSVTDEPIRATLDAIMKRTLGP